MEGGGTAKGGGRGGGGGKSFQNAVKGPYLSELKAKNIGTASSREDCQASENTCTTSS